MNESAGGTVTTHVGPSGSDADGVADGDGAGAGAKAGDGAAGELLRAGTPIGRYVIDAHVGAGAMGRIYAAHDPELDRRVAIKLLRAERNDDVGRDRLLREARALARLAHPHVVAVYDAGTVGERVFVAMEYVSGTTLTQVLAARRHGWREVLALMIPVAEGLAAVHAAGLVHRDLKPDNIMLGDDGRGRLMDFGLACAPVAHAEVGAPPLDGGEVEEASVTRTGMRIGTPPYMAPEQWRGVAADARSDQFAFCVATWEALYGERPFKGPGLAQLERAITEGRVAPPARGGDVPRWLQRALLRGLSADPAARHPSMDALIELLGHGRRRRRTVWVAIGVAAVVAAAAVSVGAVGASNGHVDRGRPPAGADRVVTQLPAHRDRCDAPQVCAQGPFAVPVCMRANGDAVGDSRPCVPGAASRCPERETCVTTSGPRGDVHRCLHVCEVQDDRPACVPGCYNQQCAGTFDLCARAQGTCRPVPCATDDDCASVASCDFPARGVADFRCDVEAGFCERGGLGAVPGPPAP